MHDGSLVLLASLVLDVWARSAGARPCDDAHVEGETTLGPKPEKQGKR